MKDGHPVPRLGREVRAGVERLAAGREEHRHRPAALPGHRDGRVHVERVDVGPLLAVDLDVDEVLVHQRRRRRALERLVRHHVAPVAGAVADRERGSAGPRSRARSSASSPHGYQSTGLSACWRRYGLVSSARRFMRKHAARNAAELGRRSAARAARSRASSRAGARAGAGARRTASPGDELRELGARDVVGARDVERAGDVERGELEQRRGEVADLHRRADLVVVERHRGSRATSSCFDGSCPGPPTISDVRTIRASGRGGDDAPLGIGLRAARTRCRATARRPRRTGALAAVEDDVGREVNEPGADARPPRGRRSRTRRRRSRARPRRPGGRRCGSRRRGAGARAAPATAAASRTSTRSPRRPGREPQQLGAEEPGRAGDVDPHASASDAAPARPAVPLRAALPDQLDHERHGERDPEPEQHALPRLLLELLAADVPEHRRVGRPDAAGDEVVAEEAVPGQPVRVPGGERDGGAPERDEARDRG